MCNVHLRRGQCPWEEDLEYCKAVCSKLGVQLHVVPMVRHGGWAAPKGCQRTLQTAFPVENASLIRSGRRRTITGPVW